MYLKGVQVKMSGSFTRVYMIVELTYVPPLANIWIAQIVGIDRYGELAKSFLPSVRTDEIFDDNDVFIDGIQIDCMSVKEQVNAGKLTYLLPLEGVFEINDSTGRFFMRFIDKKGTYRFDFFVNSSGVQFQNQTFETDSHSESQKHSTSRNDEDNTKRYEILSFEQVRQYFLGECKKEEK